MTDTVLVTGGAGYIGSHVCKALSKAGFAPVVVDNLSRGHEWAAKWGPLEVLDLRDTARLEDVIESHAPTAVVHLAAFAYVGESVERPALYYENNVIGMLSLLSAMAGHQVRYFVLSSTCAVYGVPERLPITEDMPERPINPYGFSKVACERFLRDLGPANDFRSVSLRYFNAAGADPEGEIGESHDPETHLVPLAIRAALDKNFTLSVFGDDYETPDGTAIRDYVHVSDLADAHVSALLHLKAGGDSAAVNLGTGHGQSVNEVIESVERASGLTPKTTVTRRRPGDPAHLVADPSAARRLLKWAPQRSEMDTIVADALAWHTKAGA